MGFISKTIRGFLKILLKFYKFCISPYLGNHCRFYPSCSEYAQQALAKYTLWQALKMITRRLLRCQPMHPGGVDLP